MRCEVVWLGLKVSGVGGLYVWVKITAYNMISGFRVTTKPRLYAKL